MGDELWFVVDTDKWENGLYALSDLCSNTKNWFLANSNPCFEVWLYYHFDCAKVAEGNSQAMKQILNRQRAGGYKLQDYIVHIERALQCCLEMDKFPEQSIADVGITKVYQLCIKILELLPKTDGRINFGVQP